MSGWSAHLTGMAEKEICYEKDVVFCNVTGLDFRSRLRMLYEV